MYDKETIDLWIRRAEKKAATNIPLDVAIEIAQAMIAYNSLYGTHEGGTVDKTKQFLLNKFLPIDEDVEHATNNRYEDYQKEIAKLKESLYSAIVLFSVSLLAHILVLIGVLCNII